MTICIGLIPTIDNKDTHDIIVITDSTTAASKSLNSRSISFKKSLYCSLLESDPFSAKITETPYTFGNVLKRQNGLDISL